MKYTTEVQTSPLCEKLFNNTKNYIIKNKFVLQECCCIDYKDLLQCVRC